MVLLQLFFHLLNSTCKNIVLLTKKKQSNFSFCTHAPSNTSRFFCFTTQSHPLCLPPITFSPFHHFTTVDFIISNGKKHQIPCTFPLRWMLYLHVQQLETQQQQHFYNVIFRTQNSVISINFCFVFERLFQSDAFCY